MNDRSKLVRIVVISVSVIIFVILAWFIYSHGFISIKNTSDISKVSYARLSNNLSSTSTSLPVTGGLVPSGDYTLIVTKKSGEISLTRVVVPHFFLSAPQITSQVSPLVRALARKGTVSVAMKNTSLVGYGMDGNVRALNPTNITGDVEGGTFDANLSSLTKSVQIDSSSIGGLLQTKTEIQPVIYNIDSSRVLYFPPLSSPIESLFTNVTSEGFSVYDIKSGDITVYTSSVQTEPTAIFNVKTSENISKFNNQPTYSYENNTIALLLGRDVLSGGDGKEMTGSLKQTITVHSLDNKTRNIINLGEGGATNIALSPNAKYVFVQNSQSGVIYDTWTGRVRFTIPYSINQFVWSNNNVDFVFTASRSGIFKGSTRTNSAINIIPYSVVRPTNISFIKNGVVYFSGYTVKTDGNSQPDVYKSELSEVSNIDSSSALSNFPHQGNNFYVDCLDNTITIQLTRYITDSSVVDDARAQKEADAYIKSKIKNLSSYKVNYSYINTDLRTGS